MRDEQIVANALWESSKPFADTVFSLFQTPPPIIRHETALLMLDYEHAIHPSMTYAELSAVVKSVGVIRNGVMFKADDRGETFAQIISTRGGGKGMVFSSHNGEVWLEWGGVSSQINAFSSMERAVTLRCELARSLPLKVGDKVGRVVVKQHNDGSVSVEACGVESFVGAFGRLVDAIISPPSRAEVISVPQPRRRGRRAKVEYATLAKLKKTDPERYAKQFKALVMARTRELVGAGVERDEARRRAYDAVKKGVQRASRALKAQTDPQSRAKRTKRDVLPPMSRSPRTTISSRARSASTKSSA